PLDSTANTVFDRFCDTVTEISEFFVMLVKLNKSCDQSRDSDSHDKKRVSHHCPFYSVKARYNVTSHRLNSGTSCIKSGDYFRANKVRCKHCTKGFNSVSMFGEFLDSARKF